MSHPFNIMAKPVSGLCNLDCSYCYYTSKPRDLYPETPQPKMTDEVLASYTQQYLEANPQQCTFGWQGGEPLLAGLDFYRRAIELQKKFAQPGQKIENALQTNGTLLDDAWCEFLAAEGFLVGISLDGPAQWHDRYRRDPAGKGSFHRARSGLERLQSHGVEFNVLVTLHRANAPHAGDIYRYFVNCGIRYLQFIPILEREADGQPSDFSCTPEQFGQFLLDVFNLWASRDVGRVSERFLDSVFHSLLFGRSAICCHAERCADAHVLEWNGDLYACDHFVYPQWRLGNILETPLAELVECETLREFARCKTDLPTACRACEFLPLCYGGCPKHHMPLYGGSDRVNYFCEGYKRFFAEALPELRRMAEYFQRGQTPPMSSPQTDPPAQSTAETKSTPPGRNDPCPCGSGRKFKNCCG